MPNGKTNPIPQLGLERQHKNTDANKVSRLGIVNDQLNQEYSDNFTSIDPNKLKLLISHLNRPGHFELEKFDSKNYVDHNYFKNYQSQKDIEARLIKKDNLTIPQDKILFKPKETKEEFQQKIEGTKYEFLSKTISLNTTIGFIDNKPSKNGYQVNIDKKNKIVNYTYIIYYKESDEKIIRIGDKIRSTDEYKAIIVKTAGVETLFFFLENVYGKNHANFIRKGIYDTFKTELEKTSDVETLAFLYDNLPNYIKLGFEIIEPKETKPKKCKLPDSLLWQHLIMFISYDKGFKDASHPLLNVMSLITPKFCIKEFLKDPSLVIMIFNGLNDKNILDDFFGIYRLSKTFEIGAKTFEANNKDVFITLLNTYIQLNENDPEVAIFESSGAHFHQGFKKGGRYDAVINFKLDSNIVFTDDKENKVYIKNYWEGKKYLGKTFNSQGQIIDDYDHGRGTNEVGYYNPLDIVKFTQYNDNGEGITINVPAIYVKYASDIKEWEKVNEGIRLGVNILILIGGAATIASGAGSLLLYAAIADMGLAYTDIIVQSEKENLRKSEKGKEFLENWEKIYTVGGVVTFSPVAIKAIVTYGPKMVNSGAKLLQVPKHLITNPEVYKRVKDLTTKAIHSLEIPNFNKTGLKILEKGFKEFPELINAKKLQEIGVIFAKGAEDTVAVIYKGVVIASGKVKDIYRRLHKALNKLSGKNLENYLDDLLKWKAYKSIIGTGGLIKYKKVLSRNMIGQEKGMACAAACIEQLTIDYNIAKKYSQYDIFDLAEAGIENGMKNAQIEDAMIGIFGRNNIMSAGYGSYKGIDVFKSIAKYVTENGGTWIAVVREETRHAILIDNIIENSVYIRDPWPLEGLNGIEMSKPGVEAILDLDYFAKIWEQTGGIMLRVK